MAKLTEKQQALYDKIPDGWHSEDDLYVNITGIRQINAQLQRLAEKGFLDCELRHCTLYYKKK